MYKPAVNKPAVNKPAVNKPAVNKPAVNKPSYVPPNKRPQNHSVFNTYPRTEKKEPKKEFCANNPALFPSLSEVMKSSSSSALCKKTLNFSSAAAKKVEEVASLIIKSTIPSGWLHIRKHNGIIQFKYGPTVIKTDYSSEEDKFLSDSLYKYRLAREQYVRDMDVVRLGDLSDYYGEPTLDEIQEDYEREAVFWEENEGDASEESGQEFY